MGTQAPIEWRLKSASHHIAAPTKDVIELAVQPIWSLRMAIPFLRLLAGLSGTRSTLVVGPITGLKAGFDGPPLIT